MRSWMLIVAITSGCAAHERAVPRYGANDGVRCTLRISNRGIFVDGQARSRDAAVAACRSTDGAIVVIEDLYRPMGWDAVQRTLAVNADEEVAARWKGVRASLEREGIWFHVRGPAGDARERPFIVPANAVPERHEVAAP